MKTGLINIVFILVAPFLFLGIVNRVKAFWAGRKGQSLLQPLYDFFKLLKKGEVVSRSSDIIFTLAPPVILAVSAAVSLVVPLAGRTALVSFDGDFIFFCYALSLAKFFGIVSAMETGSSFEGMGASREAFLTTIAEPAFFLLIGSLAFAGSGGSSFSSLFTTLYSSAAPASGFHPFSVLITVLACVCVFLLMLTETCRVPVDDPNTHLELTMVHEVMVLDNSGPGLAMINYASAIKMFLYSSLIVNLALPSGFGFWQDIVLFSAATALVAIVTGLVESLIARLKMAHIPQFLFVLVSLSLIVLSAAAVIRFGVK